MQSEGNPEQPVSQHSVNPAAAQDPTQYNTYSHIVQRVMVANLPMKLDGAGVMGRITGLGSRSIMTLFHTDSRCTHAISSGEISTTVSG